MDLINTSFLHNKEVVMFIRLVVAAILGGIVGIERGSGDRPAGFRTHILVCVGSALFMLVSLYGFDDVYPQTAKLEEDIGQRRDSARIAAQVVSGIGFLGAGTILHEGLTIRGLTTAASLWMVSAIGLAAGSGMYFLSSVATIITMITLVTFHTGAITDVTGYLSLNGVQVKSLNVKRDKEKNRLVLEVFLKLGKTALNGGDLVRGLQGIEGVVGVENMR